MVDFQPPVVPPPRRKGAQSAHREGTTLAKLRSVCLEHRQVAVIKVVPVDGVARAVERGGTEANPR